MAGSERDDQNVASRPGHHARAVIESVFRTESCRVLATLVRLLGDLDAAEEALQDAFAAAVSQWERDGVPANPRAWLVSAGRFRAIDRFRRGVRLDAVVKGMGATGEHLQAGAGAPVPDEVADDQLRLIFFCAHPSLPNDARLALTLREVCGMTTEEIARAFLVSSVTIAQRIVRAKAKLRSERIPYEVPPLPELGDRVAGVLGVIYLVFNEGYFASSGDALIRSNLSSEAIRLGRLLVELHPDGETRGLLALMARCKPMVEELYRSNGVIIDAGLSTESTCVRTVAGKTSVTDGPYVETKEQIGNAMVIEALDLNDAIRIASMHPAVGLDDAERFGWGIEIRPIRGMEQK